MKVYIAGPYTEGAWEYNIRDVVQVADEVHEAGHTPFIPHTMTTLWALIEPKSKEEWLDFDLEWLEACDAMIRIDGDSEGADIEEDFCNEHNIPVYNGVEEFLK